MADQAALFFNNLAVQGRVPGPQARNFLAKSQLSPAKVEAIFQEADIDKDDMLSAPEFTAAFLLVKKHLANPTPVQVGAMESGTAVDWIVPNEERAHWQQYFTMVDTERQGVVTGGQAIPHFTQSKLPRETLRAVWNLCDTDVTGVLDQDEFVLAMYLIKRRIAGEPLPTSLTPNMVPPSKRQITTEMVSPSYQQQRSFSMGAALSELNNLAMEKAHASDSVVTKLDDSTKQLQKVNEDLAEVAAETAAVESEIEADCARLAGLTDEISRARRETEELVAKRTAMEKKHEIIKMEAESLGRQVEEQRLLVQAEEEKINKLMQKMHEDQEKNDRVAAEHLELQKKLKVLESQSRDLAKALNNEEERVRAKEAEVDAVRKANEALTKQIEKEEQDLVVERDKAGVTVKELGEVGNDARQQTHDPFQTSTNDADMDPFGQSDPASAPAADGSDPFATASTSNSDPFNVATDPFAGQDNIFGNGAARENGGDAFASKDDPFGGAGANDSSDPFVEGTGEHARDAESSRDDPFAEESFLDDPFGASEVGTAQQVQQASDDDPFSASASVKPVALGDPFGGDVGSSSQADPFTGGSATGDVRSGETGVSTDPFVDVAAEARPTTHEDPFASAETVATSSGQDDPFNFSAPSASADPFASGAVSGGGLGEDDIFANTGQSSGFPKGDANSSAAEFESDPFASPSNIGTKDAPVTDDPFAPSARNSAAGAGWTPEGLTEDEQLEKALRISMIQQ